MKHPDDFELLADRQIREAMERGEFEDLPGKGEPLKHSGKPYDPMWWVREFVQRETADDPELKKRTAQEDDKS